MRSLFAALPAAFVLSAAFVLTVVWPGAALAECAGQNLIEAMPAEDKATLKARTAAVPYASGLYWRASRGGEVIHLLGTYHMEDPRHAATLATLAPVLANSRTLLVEAGPGEMAALKTRLGKEPELMINTTGPTLPEALSAEDWEKLSAALRLRGVPPFFAAKLRPWYLSMLLSIPPCAMTAIGENKGLDALMIEAAEARGLPVKALEPYDTVFGIFGAMTDEEQLAMVTATLALDDKSEDMSVTMADSYFAEEGRLIWEFMRSETLKLPGYDADRVAREFATMEEAMMYARNRGWIPVIEAAAKDGPVLVAFGALHLSGQEGVLALLEKQGFTLERLSFQ
jgi:uncharacterized protein